jgi:hypothetical protein
MQTRDDHLGPAVAERQVPTQRLDRVVGAVTVEDKPARRLSLDSGAHFERLTKAPEAEEPDAVLAPRHQREPFLRGERALAAVADVRRDVAQRVGATHLGDHAVATVEDAQAGRAAVSEADQVDAAGIRIEAVLDELGERLAWVGLTEGDPTDELEGVVRLQASLDDIGRQRALAGRAAGALRPRLARCPAPGRLVVEGSTHDTGQASMMRRMDQRGENAEGRMSLSDVQVAARHPSQPPARSVTHSCPARRARCRNPARTASAASGRPTCGSSSCRASDRAARGTCAAGG